MAHAPEMSQPDFSKDPFHPPLPQCNSTLPWDNEALTFRNYCSAIWMLHTVVIVMCVCKKTTYYSTFTYLYPPPPPPFLSFCTKLHTYKIGIPLLLWHFAPKLDVCYPVFWGCEVASSASIRCTTQNSESTKDSLMRSPVQHTQNSSND